MSLLQTQKKSDVYKRPPSKTRVNTRLRTRRSSKGEGGVDIQIHDLGSTDCGEALEQIRVAGNVFFEAERKLETRRSFATDDKAVFMAVRYGYGSERLDLDWQITPSHGAFDIHLKVVGSGVQREQSVLEKFVEDLAGRFETFLVQSGVAVDAVKTSIKRF